MSEYLSKPFHRHKKPVKSSNMPEKWRFGYENYVTSKQLSQTQKGMTVKASYEDLTGPHQRQRNILIECVNKNNDDDDDDNKNSYRTEWYRTFSTSKYNFSSG
ncbi:unnamed protein product, partial [Porites evermanni]